jgi:hypothetical protein
MHSCTIQNAQNTTEPKPNVFLIGTRRLLVQIKRDVRLFAAQTTGKANYKLCSRCQYLYSVVHGVMWQKTGILRTIFIESMSNVAACRDYWKASTHNLQETVFKIVA